MGWIGEVERINCCRWVEGFVVGMDVDVVGCVRIEEWIMENFFGLNTCS